MNKTVIVGFGSPFGDDQFGWRVIEQLEAALKERKEIHCITCDHSGIDWIHQYQPTSKLLFIDAVKSGAKPGTLHHLTIKPAEFDTLPASYSSHGIGLREGIALAAEVVELPSEIEFYGVEMAQCDADSTESSTTFEQAGLVSKQLLERFSKK